LLSKGQLKPGTDHVFNNVHGSPVLEAYPEGYDFPKPYFLVYEEVLRCIS
jgi:hypothetical protein